MSFTINAKSLGRKEPIKVVESNRNYLKVLEIQKSMLSINAIDDDASEAEILDKVIKSNKDSIDFITEMLNLKGKEIDALWDLSTEETGEIIKEIVLKFQHQDPEDLEAAKAKEEKETENLTETEKK